MENKYNSFQVLVSTMNNNPGFLKDINLRSNAIVINQTNYNIESEFNFGNNKIIWVNSNTKGLSISRNIALKKATSDICLLVDDDEILAENVEFIILEEFNKIPKADVIIFNLESINNKSTRYINKTSKRLSLLNSYRYGSARIAFKISSIKAKNIKFNELFGAGGKFNSGEDSIFISDIYKNKLAVYSSDKIIAKINDDFGRSSWFSGYNIKYFFIKGVVFFELFNLLSPVFILHFLIKHHKKYYHNISFLKAFISTIRGKRFYQKFKDRKHYG